MSQPSAGFDTLLELFLEWEDLPLLPSFFYSRYCLLKFESSEDLEEVRAALHRKHIEPFKGFLKCLKTESETLKEIKMSRPELLNEEYLTKVDVKHAKLVQ